jgi:hypothetical protein
VSSVDLIGRAVRLRHHHVSKQKRATTLLS